MTALDVLTFGEALVEIMRTEIGQPLTRPGWFTGPYPSGAPFIFAVQAARLGLKSGAVGAVGEDAFGQCLLDQLKTDGVDLRGVHTLKDHTTGVAFIAYNHDGSRDFVYHARYAAAGHISPDMLTPVLFDGLRCLHVMGSSLSLNDAAYETGLRALELASDHGAKISFDPNLRPQLLPIEEAIKKFQPFLDAADVLLPTVQELLLLTGAHTLEAALRSVQQPGRVVVVTRGAEGCEVYTDAGKTHIEGFKVKEVDPTGAGDCFDAGFLARWLAGDSPGDAARYANACGALAVTEQGPMAGAKTHDEVAAFMAAQI